MNERIKELAEQAGFQSNPLKGFIHLPGLNPTANVQLEKFAELLEKEFESNHFSAGYIAGKSDGITETVKQCLFLCDQVDLVGADDCIDQIKDHFGVEE